MASLLLLPPPIRAFTAPPPPAKQSVAPTGTALAAPEAAPLPHRPAVILPGLGNNSQDYRGLVSSLGSHGVASVVAEVSRVDWLRNAAGLTDARYWKGRLRPRPVLDWYLNRVDAAVSEAKQLAQGGNVSIVGHSAGGWLARVFMEEFGDSGISLLLTLGTPHLYVPESLVANTTQTNCYRESSPPEFLFAYYVFFGLPHYNWQTPSERCAGRHRPDSRAALLRPGKLQARRLLAGAEIRLHCWKLIRCIEGAPLIGKSGDGSQPRDDAEPSLPDAADDDKPSGGARSAGSTATAIARGSSPTIRARFIGQGYKQVCGRADVWGDGVVPEVSAHLEGALNISLDGVYHSPVGSDDQRRPWYGSPSVLQTWVHHLLD